MKMRFYIFGLAALLLLSACDTVDSGKFEEEYAVEAYLIANEPLQSIRLSRTEKVNETYDFTALAVDDAAVRVNLLREDGTVETSFPFRAKANQPGVYVPDDTTVRVQPLRTYGLDIIAPNGQVSGTTVVPDTFAIVDQNAIEVVYQSTEQFELKVTRSASPGRDQNFFIFVTESLDPRVDALTPFAAALYGENEGDISLEELTVGGSPILNEGNYDINPDQTITIKLPWIAISFYGPNRLRANALDDNLYDYIRSQSVQQGGSTLSPGEIPNPIEHLNGARGVFGSFARVTTDVEILRPF